MAERVDLHVGMARAGTPYLQLLLHTNREALSSNGVDLVVDAARNLDRAARDLARGGEKHWPALAESVRGTPGRVLLSWEGFAAVGPEGAQRVVAELAPAEVRVICTVRDPVLLVPSVWQQQVRSGMTEDLGELAKQLRAGEHRDLLLDPIEVVDDWATAVTADGVRVVVVPSPAVSPTGLWNLFASAADLDPAIVPEPEWNEIPPDAVALEFHRRVNEALGDRLPGGFVRYRDLVRPVMMRSSQVVVRAATLAPDDRAWAVELGRTIAAELGQRRYAMYGDLDDLLAGPTDALASVPADDAAVVPLAADMIAGLLIALRNARRLIPVAEPENVRGARLAARAAPQAASESGAGSESESEFESSDPESDSDSLRA